MRKRNKLLFIVSLFLLIMIYIFNQNQVEAESNTKIDQEIYSNFIIDAKTMKIDDKNHSALLGDDYIYVIDNQGEIVKKINYLGDSNLLNQYNSTSLNFSADEISFEIIDDIDNKGTKDLLIIIKKYDFENVIAISYEDNKILWKYKPSMSISSVCKPLSYCEETLEIANYKINGNLFLISGYQLDEIDIKTGKLKHQYTYENNIWDLAIVSDINNNGSKDIAISVQPTNVLFIDGDSYKEIQSLAVATDFTLYNRSYEIRRSIWSLEYIEHSDKLLAGSEDGNIYEISPKNNEIVNKVKIFNSPKSTYGNIIDSNNEDKYESVIENGVETVFFGEYMKGNTFIDIHKINSIDSDSEVDYVVEYKPYNDNNHNFVVCTSDNSCDVDSPNTYFDLEDNNVYYYSEYGPAVKNLKTNENVIRLLRDDIFKKYYNELDSPTFKLFPLEDGFIINVNSRILFKFNLNGTKDAPFWSKPIMNYQTYEKTDDWLIIYNNIDDKKIDGFTIYDKTSKKIAAYRSEQNQIINHVIDKNHLYIIENGKDNYVLKLFSLATGEIVSETLLDSKLINEIADIDEITALYTEFYVDLNNDDITEILLKIRYLDSENNLKYAYVIYDAKNKVIMHQVLIDYEVKISEPTVYEDMTDDNYPELISISSNSATTIFRSYNIIEGNLYADYSFDINTEKHGIKKIEDLNGDNHKEIIVDTLIVGVTKTNKIYNNAFIVDLAANKVATLTNTVKDNFTFVIQSINELNQDDKKEIVVYHTDMTGSNSDENPIKVSIYNYDDGQLEEIYKENIIIGMKLIKDGFIPNYVAFLDVNNDENKELIFYRIDRGNNFEIITKNLSGEIVETFKMNLLTRNQDVTIDVTTSGYKPIEIISFMGHDYYKISASSYFSYISALLDTDDYNVWNYTSVYFAGIYKDKFLYNDAYSKLMNITTPISTDDIKSEIKGIFNNVYHFKINSKVKMKSVHISYQNIPYTEFVGNEIKVSLPESKYDMIYAIRTEDGGYYYYTDFFEIEDSLSQTAIHFTLLFSITIGSFILGKHLISKFYLQR